MKLLVIADLHRTTLDEMQQLLTLRPTSFQAIVALGDVNVYYLTQLKKTYDCPFFGILGNHDMYGELTQAGVTNLHGRTETMGKDLFGGIEGCVRYKASHVPMHTQTEVRELLAQMPYVDVMLSHNSPYGVHDANDVSHEGYKGLSDYITRQKPKYCLHGHMHQNARSTLDETEVIGIYGAVIFSTLTGSIQPILAYENVDSKYYY